MVKLTSPQGRTREIDRLASQLIHLEDELNSNIPATLWISDLHGAGNRFKSILRGRFGMLYQTCREALPKTFSHDKIQYLTRLIRKRSYQEDKTSRLDRQDVILCLVQILKYKLANIRSPIRNTFQPQFQNTIERLLSGLPVPDSVFEEDVLAERLIAHLAHAVRQVLLDHILVLGDVFDRGSQPDKIIRILSSRAYAPMVDYVLGNHDILWMGAAAGNRSLIAEAIRISCRYDNFDLLERLGFDSSRLTAFAEKTYPVEKISGKFKAKTKRGLAMEKALTIIQFKLEEETIRRHPEYEMDSRLWLKRLTKLLAAESDQLNDHHFPTVDPGDPGRLSAEEGAVIDDLEGQFAANPKLKRILRYLFQTGKTYHVHNNALNIHALVPATADGEFEEFGDRRGKQLLDHIQKVIRRTGENYLAGRPQRQSDQDLFFYLWCGPRSPFFGKHAMKTFERYFLLDKESHSERTLYWKSNLQSDAFKEKLKSEFGVKRVIYGHTPVDYAKGKQMASQDGVAINVDGGFSEAYYNRGHALVQTPHQLYGIILPTPDEIKEAAKKLKSVPLDIELIDEFRQPLKVKDTAQGQFLRKRCEELRQQIRELAQ
ncbi:MAG: fructose-bisphosphatase class III [Thermodesulfobacteriota bacterium]